tara:strand:+ start:7785 stop:8738 length:954 start_codon:yes stop_codon:yes gene_type:complete
MLSTTIQIGVSQCLLGDKVRFDGGHKLDKYIANQLSSYFDFVPHCPEVAIGMGVPRPAIRLMGDIDKPRVIGATDNSIDVTDELVSHSKAFVKTLPSVSGYILKSKSPTCGMSRVKVYQGKGIAPLGNGVGVYARELLAQHSNLPVEEEGRLNDPALRENFIERVFAMRRWQEICDDGITAEKLVLFHSQHKLSLMAHHAGKLKALGSIVAKIDKKHFNEIAQQYFSLFMQTMRFIATRRKHTNVLQHLMGYLKDQLDKDDKQELLQLIMDYHKGHVPLIAPVTLLQHYFRKFPDAYIERQTYLAPYPGEFMLRNLI